MMYGYSLLDVVDLTELAERDREPREPSEVAELYYGLSEHLGDRPGADVGQRAGARRPVARAGPARPARRPVRLAARDHPRRAARSRARHAGGRGHRAVGAGQRVAAGAGAGGAARGAAGRAARSRHPVGGVPPAARAGALVGCFVTEVPLRWTDQDAYRHLNHASAVTVLEEARIDLFFDARRRGRASRVRRRAARRRAERGLPAAGRLPVRAGAGRDVGRRGARRVVPDPLRAARRAGRRRPGRDRRVDPDGDLRPRRGPPAPARPDGAGVPRPGGRRDRAAPSPTPTSAATSARSSPGWCGWTRRRRSACARRRPGHRHRVGVDAVRRARHPHRARPRRPVRRHGAPRTRCSPRWPSSGRRPSTPARAALWPGDLPPDTGWSPRRRRARGRDRRAHRARARGRAGERRAARAAHVAAGPDRAHGERGPAGPTVKVPLRCLFALSGMGFVGGRRARCGSRPPAAWLRLDAHYGAVVRRRTTHAARCWSSEPEVRPARRPCPGRACSPSGGRRWPAATSPGGSGTGAVGRVQRAHQRRPVAAGTPGSPAGRRTTPARARRGRGCGCAAARWPGGRATASTSVSSSWRATVRSPYSAGIGSHGSPVVNPKPGGPPSHGSGTRRRRGRARAVRPTRVLQRLVGRSPSGRPSSSPL